MEWITITDRSKIREYLPLDGNTFLALWKGQFCLASYDDIIDHFWLQMLPGAFTGDLKVEHEREGKFTHWCKLEFPKDY
jgi:hypothetical protein